MVTVTAGCQDCVRNAMNVSRQSQNTLLNSNTTFPSEARPKRSTENLIIGE